MTIRNTYSPWDELRDAADLVLEWRAMAGRLGEYSHWSRTIVLDPRMPFRQRRSVLCHELRHASVGDMLTDCERVNLRQEQWADREAARLLINVHDLAEALVLHDQHISAAAVELHVSDKILRVRLENLHPSEKHFLRQALDPASNESTPPIELPAGAVRMSPRCVLVLP